MKKTILIIILLLMVGWTIFDFVMNENQKKDEVKQSTEMKNNEQKTKSLEKNKNLPDEFDQTQEIGLEIGEFAPNIELSTIDGEKRNLYDLRGEPVLLNFWASWCPPCRAEMPDMEKIHQDKGMELFSVNLTSEESSKEKVKTFVKDFKLTFPILLDEDGEITELYRLNNIPVSYILDKDGRIFYKAIGPMNYDFMVNKYEEVQKSGN